MSLRTDRVGSLIKEELGAMFSREYRDASFGFITIIDVRMTPDLRIAKIYVSIFGSEKVKEETLARLEEDKPRIRWFVGSHVRLKFTPSIQFYLDDTLDQVEKINRLIRETHSRDNEKS